MNDKLNVKIDNLDYVELNDKYIIYNVPIVAELVQPYNDGMAYKPASEIKKIKVDNVPVTMMPESPSHPDKHIGQMSTDEKARVTVGYLSEPSKPKKNMDERKRYADYILYKNSLTDTVMDAYKKGVIIDTSIGFEFDPVQVKGKFDGVNYDYQQTNIRLDHNAILMDEHGRIGVGRMPSPIGGIGADSNDVKNNEVVQMENDEMKKELDSVKAEVDSLKLQNEKLSNDAVELQKTIDSLTAEVKTVKDEKDAMAVELKKAEDAIQQQIAKEKAEVDELRKDLSTKIPDMAEFFADAKDDLIRNYHKKLSEKQSRDIGKDMSGNKENKQSLQSSTKDWIDNATKARKGE